MATTPSRSSKSGQGGADLYVGGSFDPPHLGHLYAAQEALDRGGFGRALFVPTGRNPLKETPGGASPGDRLEMLRRAIALNDAFAISEAEIDRVEPSFTIDTVERLLADGELREASERAAAGVRPVDPRPGLMIGDDLLDQLDQWREIDRLLRMVRLVVVARNGFDVLPAIIPKDALLIDNVPVPISSAEIRRRLREGSSIRYLVPDGVYEYIQRNRIYRRSD